MSSRYYETSKKDEEIKPGKISAELRAALNIADNDLPVWIYRMRALGYPPGWLNKAVVDTSDIFDTDDNDESGKRKNPSDDIKYDLSKLIEYPGFNSPLPPNTVDYHYYYNMPPMLSHQQLDYAKQHMNAFKPAPMPKRIRTSAPLGESSSAPSSARKKSSKRRTKSETNGEDKESPESPNEDEESDDDEDDGSDDDEEDSHQSASNDANDLDQSKTNKSNLSSSLKEEIKLVSKGSPMPKPVERMPLEKFSEGVVGELLYFENTPNSSGKFDSIRGLLNEIRNGGRKSDVDGSFEADNSKAD